jgi:predicted metalloendopeptidase
VATATAQAIQQVALAIQSPGGMDAVNLKVAEKYVEAFSKVAKEGNTLILPGNLADMGGMVAAAMSIVKAQKS